MFGNFLRNLNERRFKQLLGLFFIALLLPTITLVSQTYSQLKWESFHQFRIRAEELTQQIDRQIYADVRAEDARSFADFNFLVVSGAPSANFLQRSPLAEYPPDSGIAGLVGYFQVDANGRFSSPILPPPGTSAQQFGINEDEYSERRRIAQNIQNILSDNQLVRSNLSSNDERRSLNATPVAAMPAGAATNSHGTDLQRTEEENVPAEIPADSPLTGMSTISPPSSAAVSLSVEPQESTSLSESETEDRDYSQQVFDQLSGRRQVQLSTAENSANVEADKIGEDAFDSELQSRPGNISDIAYDGVLQKKSEDFEARNAAELNELQLQKDTPLRSKKRTEKITLPETTGPLDEIASDFQSMPGDLRIRTFESEIDPFEFSPLNNTHFVFYRKVWRGGDRLIQGFLVDRGKFIEGRIESSYAGTTLSEMSQLVVAYQGEILQTYVADYERSSIGKVQSLDGSMLLRGQLSAPLDAIELIYSINRLPAGSGASALGWITLVIGVVFTVGFYLMYRMGITQISLVRQQQDFVSAVSHELKTPLTSIRMYGEILQKGWAIEEKKQTYYDYIYEESERLSRLISNVLHLAKITRNDPQLNLQIVSAANVLDDISSNFEHLADRAGFVLDVGKHQNIQGVNINIDNDYLKQIIINLVDNAIKFSKNAEKKVIQINCRKTKPDELSYSVRDFGPGVPKDQLRRIFEMFYRTETELTRETVGTGIGLAIVQQLTNAMNGSVNVMNQQPGAEFSISFPIVQSHDASTEA